MNEPKKKPVLWTMAQAVHLCQTLDPMLRESGYFCGLTGGVLHKGESRKDLDLCIMPLDGKPWPEPVGRAALFDRLEDLGFERTRNEDGEHVAPSSATKDVTLWTFCGKRVDIFLLS